MQIHSHFLSGREKKLARSFFAVFMARNEEVKTEKMIART
jgi:hypothetical protein